MKFSHILFICICNLLLYNNSYSQTTESIIEKCIKASGGITNWQKIQAYQIEGKNKTPLGDIVYQKTITNHKSFYNKEKVLGIDKTLISDGNSFWQKMGDKKFVILNENEIKFKKQTANFNIFPIQLILEYKKDSIKNKLIGITEIKGKKNFEIQFMTKGKFITYFYFDVETFLVNAIKETSLDKTLNGFTYFQDFKTIDGLLIPFIFESELNEMKFTDQIEKIILNPIIPDNFFKPID